MAEHEQDVIGLFVQEACSLLEASGKKVICKSTAPNQYSVDQLRVIRQKNKDHGITELVVSVDSIILKGGGNGGI